MTSFPAKRRRLKKMPQAPQILPTERRSDADTCCVLSFVFRTPGTSLRISHETMRVLLSFSSSFNEYFTTYGADEELFFGYIGVIY